MSHLGRICERTSEVVQQCIQHAPPVSVPSVQAATDSGAVDMLPAVLNVGGFAVGVGSLVFSLMVYLWTRDNDKKRLEMEAKRDLEAAQRHELLSSQNAVLTDRLEQLTRVKEEKEEEAEKVEAERGDLSAAFAKMRTELEALKTMNAQLQAASQPLPPSPPSPPSIDDVHREAMAELNDQERVALLDALVEGERVTRVWSRRLQNPTARNAGKNASTTQGRVLKIWTGSPSRGTYVTDITR